MAVGLEFRLVGRPTPRLGSFKHGGKADQAPLPTGAGARPVQHDAEHPGHKAGAALEPVDPNKHREPGILDHFLGLSAATDNGGGDPDEG